MGTCGTAGGCGCGSVQAGSGAVAHPDSDRREAATFAVPDMTCGHCASVIAKAAKGVDAGARVEVDLGSHLVRVDWARASADAMEAAIRAAGYTPARQ